MALQMMICIAISGDGGSKIAMLIGAILQHMREIKLPRL